MTDIAAKLAAPFDPAPWAKDALFVLARHGDGQGAALYKGWDAICNAVVRAHYFRPDFTERKEVMDRFTDFKDWEQVDGLPWCWSVTYEDGSLVVTRITDHAQ